MEQGRKGTLPDRDLVGRGMGSTPNRAENSRGFSDRVDRLVDLKGSVLERNGADASPILNGSHARGTSC